MANKLKREQLVVPVLSAELASTWLIALRTAMVSAGLLSSSLTLFATKETTHHGFFATFALLFLANGIFALYVKFSKATPKFIVGQLIFDSAIVSTIIMATGGVTSPFVFLYLLLQIISAVFLSSQQSSFIALLSYCCYTTLITLDSGIIGHSNFWLMGSKLLLNASSLALGLALIQIGTSKIKNSIFNSFQLVGQSKDVAEDLASSLTKLIDELPEGIIAVDEDGSIKAINRSAASLFSLNRSLVLGKKVSEFSEILNNTFTLDKCLSKHPAWSEISLAAKDPNIEPLQLIMHKKDQQKENGRNFSGTFYIFQDITKLKTIEAKLALQEKLARALATDIKHHSSAPIELSGFVGESPLMQNLFSLIQRVSKTDATVLISGESGVGKELVARAIHLQSQRCDAAFIAVNCGAIPESLLESELFGHTKGSFTGATNEHIGLFEKATGGTIFLDEVGDMPLSMQVKLLRAIQERSIRLVGGNEDRPINIRLITATNKELKEEVEAGRFREDLFYRLNVIHLQVPPLRERLEDLPALIHSILTRFCGKSKLPVLSADTIQLLMKYDYPGNVRELENILERALVLGGGAILPEHLPETVRSAKKSLTSRLGSPTEIILCENIELPVDLDRLLNTIELHYIQAALKRSSGVKKDAAELLGINFRSFRYRLQKANSFVKKSERQDEHQQPE